jgi:RimJ/RimL family protein N-acetyltransferase
MYSIINHDDGVNVCVGICGLTSIDWINRRAEFSLYIGPEYQGSGFGEHALRLLCRHGFQTLNLNCIWGEVFESNPALAMFQRVGFKECGRRRQFYFRDGKYIDAILVDVMRNEWK